MSINWDELASNYNNFKDYAPAGVHKAKVASVENRSASTGTVWQEFKFEDSDKYAFPKVSHPLSNKNANWRAWHWKCLFELLGATEENAKKAVESCEGKGNFDQICEAYQNAMNRLVAKHPEVEIEVWADGQYSRADFNDRVRMSRPDDEPRQSKSTSDPLEGAVEINDSDVPF